MPVFSFYEIEIKKCPAEQTLFDDQTTEDAEAPLAPVKPYQTPEQCLASFFPNHGSAPLNVLVSKGKGKEKINEWEIFHNDILQHLEDVILLTIEANKVKHTIVEKKDKLNPHHPFCHVIIDLRNHYVAIEKNSAFDNKPDRVMNILSSAINNRTFLGQYGLMLTVTKLKKKRTDFWPVVNEIRTTFKDVVRQIRMDFNGEGEEDASTSEIATIMRLLAKKTNSLAAITLNAEGDQEIKLDDIYDDLANIAEICKKQKGYDLVVKFRDFGIYKYGADILAQFGVEDEVLEQFTGGMSEMNFETGLPSYGLIMWLDRMNVLLKGYQNEELVRKGRSPKRRR